MNSLLDTNPIPNSDRDTLVLKVISVTGHVTVFMKLQDLYPECSLLIQGSPQLFPLRCLYDEGCSRGMTCMEKLAKRTMFVFDTFPDADLLMLYFRHPDRPNSQRAGVFWKSGEAPHYTTFNKASWEKMKKIGQVYRWRIPSGIFLDTPVLK